jgi:hypothetical protein
MFTWRDFLASNPGGIMSHKVVGRFAAVALTAFTALIAGGQPASAAPPDSDITLPAGLACNDFDLRLQSTDSNTHTKTFKNGRTIAAGRGAVLTFTNLTTNESLTIQSHGSVSKTTPNEDGTTTVQATGHNVIILFPTDVPAGPSTILYVGRIVYTVSANNDFVVQNTSGKQTDICAQLAP